MQFQVSFPDHHHATYEASEGQSLLELVRRHRLDLASPCGGKGTCHKCRVIVDGLGEVLACQTRIQDSLWTECGLQPGEPLRVYLPTRSVARIATDGVMPIVAVDPLVCRGEAVIEPGTLTDQQPDDERFARQASMTVSLRCLNDLSRRLARGEKTLAFDFRTDTREVLRFVDPGAPAALGCAIDIGTTTLAAYLFDLETGKRLRHTSDLNPQRSFGADVISRIEHAMRGPSALAELQTAIAHGLSDLIARLFQTHDPQSQNPDDLMLISLAGNTTMMHLLCGLDPTRIAQAPFLPATLAQRILPATELGLTVAPGCQAMLLPSIASYVGADITAGILACQLDSRQGRSTILLDIGTNGEIVLSGPSGLVACSAAAGPAFEGANIACGMPAADGAIDKARWTGEALEWSVLGDPDVPIRGICGSGLVALISALLDAGVIDETGRFLDPDEADDLSTELRNRLLEHEGKMIFRLSRREEEPLVYLSQKDIRELQNAKAALAAGLQLLIEVAGLEPDQIEHLFLAGGFGSYLDVDHAVRIGLLPASLRERVVNVGNSSGMGAGLCLLNQKMSQHAARVTDKVHYYELSSNPRFTDLYVDAMFFPEMP
jgi:uncharacterized 2Fe-2S/4Fe-4S cluster protein (DUF4445 family)